MPEERPVLPRGATEAPQTEEALNETDNAPQKRPSGVHARPADLSSLDRMVEEAKARNRAALETKLKKEREKTQKKANLSSDKGYREQRAGALRIETIWREEMAAAFPNVPQIAWFKKERGKLVARKEGKQIADLLEGYGSEDVVEKMVQDFIQQWAHFGPLLTKAKDSIPTVGLLVACHATVVAEGVKFVRRDAVVEEWEAWQAANAGNPFAQPPADLAARYQAATAKAKR